MDAQNSQGSGAQLGAPDDIRTLFSEAVMFEDYMIRLAKTACLTRDAAVPVARAHSAAVTALMLWDAAKDMAREESPDWDWIRTYLALAMSHKILSECIDVDFRANTQSLEPGILALTAAARRHAELNELDCGAALVTLLEINEQENESGYTDDEYAGARAALADQVGDLLARLRTAQSICSEVQL